MRFFSVRSVLHLCAGLIAACWAGGVRAESEIVTNRFGFAGKEIFPIDYLISHLRSADFNGDGLEDLAVVNNLRSKINLLYNRTGQTNAPGEGLAARKRELNELPPDARFRIEGISSEKRISSMVAADLNGDGRPDLAYYGEPKELIVQYNGTNGWSSLKRWPLQEGLLNQNALVDGDINGDGRTDLLLLAEGFIYWLAQDEQGALAEPERIPYSGTIQAVQVLDIQGDGRQDLLLVNWDNLNPFRFRLQDETGRLGAEIYFPLSPVRSYWADDLDGDGKTEVVTIAQKSGRAQISNFVQKESEPLSGDWRQGQFQVLPLTKTAKARRGMAWKDLDGDGLADLIVAEPESGQITVFFQKGGAALGSSKSFPTLTGVSELAVGDWDGDGRPDLFVLSQDEGQIGVTEMDENGRLPFPKFMPLEGRPVALALGETRQGSGLHLFVIVEASGRRELQVRNPEGKVTRHTLAEGFRANPSGLLVHDVDQDGLNDVLVLVPYEKLKVLLQRDRDEFQEHDLALPGGNPDQPWFAVADVDGDGKGELLAPQRNFLRALVLQAEGGRPQGSDAERVSWAFHVKEQINGASSNSRLVAAAPVVRAGATAPSIFLLDAERKALTLAERNESGIWEVVRNLPLPISSFQSLASVMLGEGENPSLAFFGLESVAWLSLEGPVWEFMELDGYETPIRDAFLRDVVSGDLNQDGRKDLVFLETAKNYLDVVTFEEPHRLVPANRWQVFEERTFRSRRGESAEPREALIADFSGDGKNDLVVVVHDRIILYPQE